MRILNNTQEAKMMGAKTTIIIYLFIYFQENLIRDDNKLVLLASLSDSLEFVADSIERQVLLASEEYCFLGWI